MGNHKKWRREAKKQRRKRLRKKLAIERDKKETEEEEKKLKDPLYINWLKEQDIFELIQRETEQKIHDEEEELWMRRELLAQIKFCEERKRREISEKAKEEQRLKLQKEFEEQKKLILQKKEEKKRIEEEKQRKHELFMQNIQEYIEGQRDKPDTLKEWADSNPGKEICPFFSKVGCCRFGDKCTRNHQRPAVSNTIVLPHFFMHIRLQQSRSTEYGNDLALEFSEREVNQCYETFFDDVIPELEKFGKIYAFRTCTNSEAHLRGNVYVEYKEERDALKAYMKLQGRFYAGLSLQQKCPKGTSCNFLHIFRNPGNQYGHIPKFEVSERRLQNSQARNARTTSERRRSPSQIDFDDNKLEKRNWRWSESPELRTPSKRRSSRSRSRSSDRRRRIKRRRSRSRSKSRSSHRSERRLRRSKSRSSYKRPKSRNGVEHKHRSRSRSRSKGRKRKRNRKHKKSKSKERSDKK